MSFGGPKKAEVEKAKSSFAQTKNTSFSNDFGSGESKQQFGPGVWDGSIATTSSLSPELKASFAPSASGLESSMTYLSRNPQEQVSNMWAGNDPYYNVLNEQANRTYNDSLAKTALESSRNGLNNSSTYGAALGTLNNEDIMRRNQVLAQSMQFGNEQARANAGTNLATLTGLSNLSQPLGSAANSNLMTALASKDAMALANAQAQNAANNAYAQAQNAQGSPWGSLLSIGGTLLGNAILPGAGGNIAGGILGGLFNKGSGGGGSSGIAAMPSFVPSLYGTRSNWGG